MHGSGNRLWLIVELVLLAGIATGMFLVYLGSGAPTLPGSAGYAAIAVGIFCIIAIEVYLALRSPGP